MIFSQSDRKQLKKLFEKEKNESVEQKEEESKIQIDSLKSYKIKQRKISNHEFDNFLINESFEISCECNIDSLLLKLANVCSFNFFLIMKFELGSFHPIQDAFLKLIILIN
jgi:hypothetical protein